MEELLQAAILGGANDEEIEFIILDNIFINRDNILQQQAFNLDDWSDEDIKLCFRFERNDLPHLVEVLRIPHEVVTGTGNRVSGKNNMLLAVALKLQYKQ